MNDHTYSKNKDQPGQVANPARGQLNKENQYSLPAFTAENLVSRDGFGSPVPRQPAHLHTQVKYIRCFHVQLQGCHHTNRTLKRPYYCRHSGPYVSVY